ncbi:MAG: AAA family ATPase [Blastocatellia bacterium]
MTEQTQFQLYVGDGTTRGVAAPLFEPLASLNDPAGYVAEPGLRDAVNVALALGQPLLLTGEPGTGKTQLAGSLARELGVGTPLVFNVKTTSIARDLFYRYDSLTHFHDAQFRKEGGIEIETYIAYEALGLAVMRAEEKAETRTRSVVLIDEIDKAPRDLPNDVLNEIEAMEFTVRETGKTFRADPRYRPIVVLTSNSEKNLPDAFLRRCVFYHIEFPDKDRLREIIARRVTLSDVFQAEMLDPALARFEEIRKLPLGKLPATAELLAWVRILDRLGLDVRDAGRQGEVAASYTALAKNDDDLKRMRKG